MQAEAIRILEENHHDQQEQAEDDVLERVRHTNGDQADEDDVQAELTDKDADGQVADALQNQRQKDTDQGLENDASSKQPLN